MLAELLRESLDKNDIWVSINGDSMKPFLEDGALVLVRRCVDFSYGDIVVYKDNGDLISHRYIRKRKRPNGKILYQTKADNGHVLDRPVGKENMLGKVVAVRKNGKLLRLDNIRGRIQSRYYWFSSLASVLKYRYARK